MLQRLTCGLNRSRIQRGRQVTKVDECQISYMDQCKYRLQLAFEDADEERIMMEEDAMAAAEVAAMAAAENDDGSDHQEYDYGNNNDDIEGDEFAIQML